MSDDDREGSRADGEGLPSAKRVLSPQARRALAEAEERRRLYAEKVAKLPRELGGRNGLEPGRYGDWEVKGIASDF